MSSPSPTNAERLAVARIRDTPDGKHLLRALRRLTQPEVPSIKPGEPNDAHTVGFREGQKNVWVFLSTLKPQTNQEDGHTD